MENAYIDLIAYYLFMITFFKCLDFQKIMIYNLVFEKSIKVILWLELWKPHISYSQTMQMTLDLINGPSRDCFLLTTELRCSSNADKLTA